MKIVLVGDTQVGKTCLIKRLSTGTFYDNNPPTIGAAFQNHVLQTSKGSVSLQIWDTAGQEKFRALAPMYYRSAAVAILCFDLTNKRSFEALDQWTQELIEKASPTMKLVIVGNKKDLVNDRVVSSEDANSYSLSHGAVLYCETSALTGEGIFELFTKIAEMGDPDPGAIFSNGSDITTEQKPANKSSECC